MVLTLRNMYAHLSVQVRCGEAFEVVRRFEATHCLNVPAMGPAYVAARQNLVMAFLKVSGWLRCCFCMAEHNGLGIVLDATSTVFCSACAYMCCMHALTAPNPDKGALCNAPHDARRLHAAPGCQRSTPLMQSCSWTGGCPAGVLSFCPLRLAQEWWGPGHPQASWHCCSPPCW